ncbi:hypothetical protein Smp_127300.2, partial [Schistosoma mansoni]
ILIHQVSFLNLKRYKREFYKRRKYCHSFKFVK